MFITKKHIPRRTFLKGIGTTLALPLLESMLPAQGNRFASDAFIKLNHFEKAQEVFHTILLFGVANTGEHLDPTDARDRQT